MEQVTQVIIDNQTKYKEDILSFFSKEYSDAKKILNSIKSEDKFIIKEKKKLINKFKSVKDKKYIDRLFFLHSHRNKVFYVWWDEIEKEAKILKYAKR